MDSITLTTRDDKMTGRYLEASNLSPSLKTGRIIAVFQSKGTSHNLKNVSIKTESGTARKSAQFFKTVTEIWSGPGDLYVFIFFSLPKTISLNKLGFSIQFGLYLLDKLKSFRRDSTMTPLANVSANSANIFVTLSFSCTVTPESSLNWSDLIGPDSLVRICLKILDFCFPLYVVRIQM